MKAKHRYRHMHLMSNAEKSLNHLKFMISRLDYYDALLDGCPAGLINKLQLAQKGTVCQYITMPICQLTMLRLTLVSLNLFLLKILSSIWIIIKTSLRLPETILITFKSRSRVILKDGISFYKSLSSS